MLLGELTARQAARPELSRKLCGFRAAPITADACSALPFGHVSSARPQAAIRPDGVAQTHTFDLQNRKFVAIAGLPVGSRERMWQTSQPFAEQTVNA
jgi:hypothetical protein